MVTDETTLKQSQLTSDRVIDATYDFQFVDANDSVPTQQSLVSDQILLNESHFELDRLWQTLLSMASRGHLSADSSLCNDLVELLMTSGVLPANSNMDQSAITLFHQWFLGMDSGEVFSDSMTLLEGLLLSAWANKMDAPFFDQVIVFDALNGFQQYASYCQVVLGDEVITLSYYADSPIDYDSNTHSSFGILHNDTWSEPTEQDPIDYQNAHLELTLSDLDKSAISDWVHQLFPDGVLHLTDDEILLALFNELNGDGFTYQADIGDHWESMSQFLASKTGDCEEFSHLYYHALDHIYALMPDRSKPDIQLVAGLIGSGLNVFGHSMVLVERGGNTYVVDPTGPTINSMSDLPLLTDYTNNYQLIEYLRYTNQATDVRVDVAELVDFSTSSDSDMSNLLNREFQNIFGNDRSFDSVISDNDQDFEINSYDSLIQKVIAKELKRLIESGNAQGIFTILNSELDSFRPVDFSGFHNFDSDDVKNQFINGILESHLYQVSADGSIEDPIFREEFLGGPLSDADVDVLFQQLQDNGLLVQPQGVSGFAMRYDYHFGVSSNDIWDQLVSLGFITEIGMIDKDVLTNSTKQNELRAWFSSQGSDYFVDDLISLMDSRTRVFSTTTETVSDDPFESALLGFDAVTEELLIGLTSPTRPLLANPGVNSNYTIVSPYVSGGYDASSQNNSLFIRVEHQKLQETMSRMFALQNVISAFMTVAFSASDMISSIAAKLGDDNSTASSTARQRQKIMQSFNTYSSGLTESINTLMDLFDKTVEKTNESRYQTALSELDLEYNDVVTQLGNEFLANHYEINKETLKADLSQDYYNMLFDNRSSMQQAMLDVPQFGPNVMPSQFSYLFLNDDRFKDINSFQVWGALFANGVIDEYGQLNNGVDLSAIDMTSINYDIFEVVYNDFNYQLSPASDFFIYQDEINTILINHETPVNTIVNQDTFSSLNSDVNREDLINELLELGYLTAFEEVSGGFIVNSRASLSADQLAEADRMKTFIFDQVRQYERHIDTLSSEDAALLTQFVQDKLIRHQASVQTGFQVFSANNFDTSRYLFAYMDMMERSLDSNYTIHFDRKNAGFELDEQHNVYGVDDISLSHLVEYESINYYYLLGTDYDVYQHDVEMLLRQNEGWNDTLTSSDFDFVPENDRQTLLTHLVDKGFLNRITELPGEHYGVYSQESADDLIDAADILDALKSDSLVSDDNVLDKVKIKDFNNKGTIPEHIQALFNNVPNGDFIASALMKDLHVRSRSNALHLTTSAAHSSKGEGGSGFQMVNTSMIAMARKNLMLMNTTRRIFMTLVSSYTLFFEKVASKLSKDSTQASHYSDWQNSLMESHLGLAERQLSSIHSETVSMVSRINELHKHRLNLVKMSDSMLRGLDISSTWSSLTGALLMLTPTPITQFLGIIITMASSIMSLAGSWRGYQLEQELDQLMDDGVTGSNYNDFLDQAQGFFTTNLPVDSSGFSTLAGDSVDSDVVPRRVVDYENAHLYINPNDEHVQALLNNRIFPDGIPSDYSLVIESIHQFMKTDTEYVSDGAIDDWASVGDVATRLNGDCEDLVNLESSLILAALQSQGIETSDLTSHAAYVTLNDQRMGHVYLTTTINGEPMVLDPSLESDGFVSLATYQARYQVDDVFTYNQSATTVLNPAALGIQTSGFFNDIGDLFGDLFSGLIPDDFFNMFIPDKDAVLNHDFHSSDDASESEMIGNFFGQTIDLMLSTFVGNIGDDGESFFGSLLGDATQYTAQGLAAVMDPLIKSFAPGSNGYNVASDALGMFQDIITAVVGDSFVPDRDKIQQLIKNRFLGENGSILSSQDGDGIIDELIGDINADINLANLYHANDYDYRINSQSEFFIYQKEIDEILKANYSPINTIINADTFGFLSEPELRQSLVDYLVMEGYLTFVPEVGNGYVVNAYDNGSASTIEFYISPSSEFYHYQQDIDQLLRNKSINEEIQATEFSFLSNSGDQDTLFDYLKGLNYLQYVPEIDGWIVNTSMAFSQQTGSFSTHAGNDDVMEMLIEHDDAAELSMFQTSSGSLSSSASRQVSLDYSTMIHTLFDAYDNNILGTGGYLSQGYNSGDSLSNPYMSPDENNERVVLNQFNLGHLKDDVRILQEQLRFVYTIAKIVSDALITIAAQVGDENKIKQAVGLQKIFESSFGMVAVDIQLKDYLLSHYESVVNHNFDVNKIRYERTVDSSFKTANMLPMLLLPQYGQLIESAMDIFESFSIYFDFWGNNPYTDHYLKEDHFWDYLNGRSTSRYHISSDEEARRTELSQGSSEFSLSDIEYDYSPLVQFRENSFNLLQQAANIDPIETGYKLSLMPYDYLSVDYNEFNKIRDAIVGHGMNAQHSLIMMMSMTGYLSSLTKSIRGDSKIGGQHLSSLVDVMEREITHDLDELSRIQSLQEQFVSLHNQKFESLKRIEKSYYELIFFGLYFASRFISSLPMAMIDIIGVKAFANMFQGILLSGPWRKNELEDELEDDLDTSKPKESNAVAIAYSPGQPSSINYSGISQWEQDYMDFSTKPSNVIFSSKYGNTRLSNFFGLGFQSVNWFEQARQNMLLKKLFTQWNLILKSGQSVAEAYQSIADELGATTASLSYTSALKSQMSLQKNKMTKSLDNRFSLVGQVVSIFNKFQTERFETFQQFFKILILRLLNNRLKNSDARQSKDFNRSSKGWFGATIDAGIHNLLNFSEDILRVIAASARRSQIMNARQGMMENAEADYIGDFKSGSFSESLLYMSNIRKAQHRVDSDIIQKIKYFDGFFKKVVMNLIDSWKSSAQNQGKKDLQGDGKHLKEQGDRLAKSLMTGNHNEAQQTMKEFSAFLTESKNKSTFNRGFLNFNQNFLRSISSMFSRRSEKEGTHSIDDLENSSSVWSSINRLHKQMIRYGGDQMAGTFKNEMDQLRKTIDDLHTMNKLTLSGSVTFDQMEKVQLISQGIKRLDNIAAEFDDYRRHNESRLWQKLRLIRTPHRAPLSALSKNIDHFAVYGSVGMAVELNKNLKSLSDKQQQQLLSNLRFIRETDEKNSHKVFQDLGEFFTRMSQHQGSFGSQSFLEKKLGRDVAKTLSDERSTVVDDFFESTLSYNAQGNGRLKEELQQSLKDFSKHILAAKKHGADSTLQLVTNSTLFSRNSVLNDSDGVVNVAMKMGNKKGAKHLLHPHHGSLQNMYAKMITTPGEAKQYARALVNTMGDPDHVSHTLGDGVFSSASLKQWMGLGEQYKKRLRSIVNRAVKDIRQSTGDVKKQKIAAALEFATELSQSSNRVSMQDFLFSGQLVSDYIFDQLKAMDPGDMPQLDDFNRAGISVTPEFEGVRSIKDQIEFVGKNYGDNSNISASQVKKALIWSKENPQDSEWYRSLFANHSTEFVEFLIETDNPRFFIDHLDASSFVDQTTAIQLHTLGLEGDIYSSESNQHSIDWRALRWPVNYISDFDFTSPLASIILQDLNKLDKRTAVLQSVPGGILDRLLVQKRSQFQYPLTRENDVEHQDTVSGSHPNPSALDQDAPPTVPLTNIQPSMSSSGVLSDGVDRADLENQPAGGNQAGPQGTVQQTVLSSNDLTTLNAIPSPPQSAGSVIPLSTNVNGLPVGGQPSGDIESVNESGGASNREIENRLQNSLNTDQDVNRLQTDSDTVGSNEPESQLSGLPNIKIDLDLIKEAFRYQPDLALRLLYSQKLSSDQDMAQLVGDLASVTAWVMDPVKVGQVFLNKFNDQQKEAFLNQILLQDDRAAETFFSLTEQPDFRLDNGSSSLSGAVQEILDKKSSLDSASLKKAQFFMTGATQHMYDDLSQFERSNFLSDSIGKGRLNVKDIIQDVAHAKEDDVKTIKEDIKKDIKKLSDELNQAINGHSTREKRKSIIKENSIELNNCQQKLFYLETLKPALDKFDGALKQFEAGVNTGNVNDDTLKKLKETQAITLKKLKETQAILQKIQREDNFNGGAHKALIYFCLNDMLKKESDSICNMSEKLDLLLNNTQDSNEKKNLKSNKNEFDQIFLTLFDQFYSPGSIMLVDHNPSNANTKEKGFVFQKRVQERVKSLVKGAVLRDAGYGYRPVSELVAMFSLVPEDRLVNVYQGVLEQFNALASDQNLASVVRMLDVVVGLYNQFNSGYDQDVQSKLNKETATFLNHLLESGVELNNHQRFQVLQMFNKTSDNQENPKPIDFYRLEQMIGMDVISNFLVNVESETREETGFLKGLQARMSLQPLDRQPENKVCASQLFTISQSDFRAFCIGLVQDQNHTKTLHQWFKEGITQDDYGMLNEFYNICSQNGDPSFERTFFNVLKKYGRLESFALTNMNDKSVSEFQKAYFSGFSNAFIRQQQPLIKAVFSNDKSVNKTIWDIGQFRKINVNDFRGFIKTVSNDAIVEGHSNSFKILDHFLFDQSGNIPRELASKKIQFVLDSMFQSHANPVVLIQEISRYYDEIPDLNKKEMLYAELAHYFKKPDGPLYSSSQSTAYRDQSALSSRQRSTILKKIIRGNHENELFQAHLLVSMSQQDLKSASGLQMRPFLKNLSKEKKVQFVQHIERLVSPKHLKWLQDAFSDVDFFKDIKLARGHQMSLRRKMAKAAKIKKLHEVNTPYELISFFRQYEKYTRNFEEVGVDRTKSMSVSHIGGSLSIGT